MSKPEKTVMVRAPFEVTQVSAPARSGQASGNRMYVVPIRYSKQERIKVLKQLNHWQTLDGSSRLDEQSLGIVAINMSEFLEYICAVGFQIDEEPIQLSKPCASRTGSIFFPLIQTGPGKLESLLSDGTEIFERWPVAIPSKGRMFFGVTEAEDRRKIVTAVLAASKKHNLSVEALIHDPRLFQALVVTETRKQFSSRQPTWKKALGELLAAWYELRTRDKEYYGNNFPTLIPR